LLSPSNSLRKFLVSGPEKKQKKKKKKKQNK
jgi:hypothetical protein